MKIGIVGYQGSGKSSLFHWLTGVQPDLSLSHSGQTAAAIVPDDRLDSLHGIYNAKKITRASINLVDTPGLNRDHSESAAKLALIREASCLAIVVGDFAGADIEQDLQSFEEDLLIADLELMSGRVARLTESIKKPRPNRDKEIAELEALQPLLAELDSGKPLHEVALTNDQRRVTKSFQLLTQKPRIIIVNVADDQPVSRDAVPGHNAPVWRLPISLQCELQEMEADERQAFCDEMGVAWVNRTPVLQSLMDASGQMLFFTAGEKRGAIVDHTQRRNGRGSGGD